MHVLVAVDRSDPAREALEYAVAQHPGADLTLLHVIDLSGSMYGEYAHVSGDALVESRREEASALFEELRELTADHEGRVETDTVVGQPAQRIVSYAEEEGVDHVIVGSHGRSGVSRVLLGSVAELVARRATVPVTIVR